MNHIFGPYIGVFMDVYLDDIIVYYDTVEDHIKHLRIILDVLRREQLYLISPDKLQFFAKKVKILGHVIDERELVMDPIRWIWLRTGKSLRIKICYLRS